MSRASPELDAEQEVDFGRYWRALVMRWWLPLVGIAAGAVIGALVTLGGSTRYAATAQVYLGEPLAPGAGGQILSVPTRLGLISNLVTGEAIVKRVADKVGLRPSRLKSQISTKTILADVGGRVGAPTPLIEIIVTGASPAKDAAAANELAALVVRRASVYVDTKIQVLKDHDAYDARQLALVRERLAIARQEQQAVLADKSLGLSERLISLENFNSVIVSSQGRQSALEQDQFSIRQLLTLAREVERSRIVEPAVAERAAAPSRRTAVVIGAFIGLIVGIFAALLWEPVVARARPQPQQ